MMRKNKEEGYDHRKVELEKMIRGGGPITQKAYAKHWDSKDDVKTNNQLVVGLFGSRVEEWVQSGPGLDSLAKYLTGKVHKGIHFNFAMPQGSGAHAVAFWRSGGRLSGHYYFFDPNFGEYKGSPKEVSGWFVRFIGDKYGPPSNVPWWYLLVLTEAATVKGGWSYV
jgi:hypothetical protein